MKHISSRKSFVIGLGAGLALAALLHIPEQEWAGLFTHGAGALAVGVLGYLLKEA